MIIKMGERKKSDNGKSCVAYEYPLGDREIDVAFIEVDGRYPSVGCVTNTVVKETVFVIEGRGKVVIDDIEHLLGDHDAILILPKQKYFFDGKFKLVVSCSPAWYAAQHREC
jgi:mannose-6-phosphate isomerase-like protein (cupin superfamily)